MASKKVINLGRNSDFVFESLAETASRPRPVTEASQAANELRSLIKLLYWSGHFDQFTQAVKELKQLEDGEKNSR